MHDKYSANIPKTAREIGIMQGFPPPPEKRPTLDNWDLAPFNRWSFQNMRVLFPTVEVAPAKTPRRFDEQFCELSDVEFNAIDGRCLTIDRWLGESYTDGFLVLKGDQIVTERYFNDLSSATPHLGQSVSKSIIGALAGVLHGEGKLDLAAPLEDFIPELADCGYSGCTVDHALDMLSGVRFTEDYGLPDSDMTRVDVAAGWRPVQSGGIKPTIRDVILTLPKERSHGGKFAYRSIETDVIAWVLERVGGADLATLLSDRIWQKIGCAHAGFFTVDAAGTALADGGFNATLRDYARFGRMIADGGRVGDCQVVPKAWIDGICTGANPSKFGDPYTLLSPNGAYRRFWWVHDPQRRVFMARGVFGQLVFIDQQADVVIVKLSSWPDYLIQSFSQDAVRACQATIRAIGSGCKI